MLLVAVIFFVLLFLNMPVSFAIGIASLAFFFTEPNLPTSLMSQRIVAGTQSFPLLAVPFFILAGNLMNASGITSRLLNFANALAGHLAGSLAHVSIILSTIMGGVSGSANADAAMQSRILGPQMKKRGYAGGFSAGAIAVGSLITATIPPSIGLILYGFVGEVSIGDLFLAGIIPGVLMMIFLMSVTYIVAKKRGYDAEVQERPSLKKILVTFKDSIWAILFPVILIVGIRFGLFTASEVGAFAAVYAIFIGFFIYREMNFRSFMKAIEQSVIDNATILLIIAMSGILSYLITYNQLPNSAVELLTGITSDPMLTLFLILVFLLIMGMFIESTVLVLLLTPIFMPIIQQVGIDPVHFGILMMTIVTFGGMTPPVGVTMYTVCSLTDVSIEDYVKEAFPYMLAVIVLVAVLAIFPEIVLFIPNLF